MPKERKVAPTEIRNRRAFHDYTIEERFEAGLALRGTEVKSVRVGKAQISDAFVRFQKNRPILFNSHIEEYAFGSDNNHAPRRPRKLLLNRREINRILGQIQSGGKTVIPLRLYFKKALVKVEIAVAVGKKMYDKRETLKRRLSEREAEREVRYRQLGKIK